MEEEKVNISEHRVPARNVVRGFNLADGKATLKGRTTEYLQEKLVEGLKKGDEDAFRFFMAKYKEIVYDIIYSVAGNSPEVDDIAQSVFITVFRKIHKFKGKSALSTWLYRVTVNKCKDFFRKRKPTVEMSEEMLTPALLHSGKGTGKSSASPLEEILNEKFAKALLAELPVKYRIPVVLRIEGFSYKEIAETLKISLEKVKIFIFRAREKMREAAKKYEM